MRCLSTDRLLIICLILSVNASAWADRPIELEMNLKPGETLIQTMEIRRDGSAKNAPSEYSMVQSMTGSIKVLERNIATGIMQAEILYERLRFQQVGGPEGNSNYDSKKTPVHIPENLPWEIHPYISLLNRSIRVEYNTSGQIVHIIGTEGVLQAMLDGLIQAHPEQAPRNEEEALNLKSGFFHLWINPFVEMSSRIYPKHALSLGDTWEYKQAFSSDGQQTLVSTYTLKDFNADRITLNVAGVIDTVPKSAPSVLRNGIKIKTKLHGTQSGECIIDRKTGWLISSMVLEETVDDGMLILPNGKSIKQQQGGSVTRRIKITTDKPWSVD